MNVHIYNDESNVVLLCYGGNITSRQKWANSSD